MTITFRYNGKQYTYQGSEWAVIILPDGTMIQAQAIVETMPPMPTDFIVLPGQAIEGQTLEELADLWGAVLATEIPA